MKKINTVQKFVVMKIAKKTKEKKIKAHRETISANKEINMNQQNDDEEYKISINDKTKNNEIKKENDIINKVNSTKETIFQLEVEENVPFPTGEHL